MISGRQAQVGELSKQIVDEFEQQIKGKPMPLSSRQYPSGDHSNKNTNKTNPFIDNGGTIKSDGDDQSTTQLNFNDMGGYLPVMAGRRERLRKALFDEQQYPAGMDRPQGGWAPEDPQMDPFNKEQQPKRNWNILTDQERALKDFKRTTGPEDQIDPGISNPTLQLWDGEQL